MTKVWNVNISNCSDKRKLEVVIDYTEVLQEIFADEEFMDYIDLPLWLIVVCNKIKDLRKELLLVERNKREKSIVDIELEWTLTTEGLSNINI